MAFEYRLDARRLREMEADTAGRDRWLRGVGNQMVGDIVLSFGTSPPGRQYGSHVASVPGHPPNVDTGDLRNSIRLIKVGNLRYRIVDGVSYGAELELGLREGVAARPFIEPVFADWQTKIEIEAENGLVT